MDTLNEKLKLIHSECFTLCKKLFGKYFPVAGNIAIFSQSEIEYENLIKLAHEITEFSEDLNQKYFRLLDPIIFEEENLPETIYTYLYIRKPDPTPYGKHIGDIDFILNKNEYELLVNKIDEKNNIPHAKIYVQNNLKLVELSDSETGALAYVVTEEISERMRYK